MIIMDLSWAVSIMVVGAVSVITNLAQVAVIRWRRKKNTPFCVSILSLSAADLLASAMFVMHGLRKFLTRKGMTVNSVLLRFAYTGCYFSVSSSCLHIIFIAIQRIIVIRYPLKSKNWLTIRRVFIAVFLMWFVSAAFACLSALRLFPSHAMSFYIFASGAVIVLAYMKICMETRKRTFENISTGHQRDFSRNEIVLIHSFVIMIAFVLCTFPYAAARFFSHDTAVYMVCDIIFALNPLLDPMLYFFVAYFRTKRKNNAVAPNLNPLPKAGSVNCSGSNTLHT